MGKLYIATIAEVHEDLDIFLSVFTGTSKKVINDVNRYFEEEKSEGHPTREAPFDTVDEMNGFDSFDDEDDRHYHIMVTITDVPEEEILNDREKTLLRHLIENEIANTKADIAERQNADKDDLMVAEQQKRIREYEALLAKTRS